MSKLFKIRGCSYTGSTNGYKPDITDVFRLGRFDVVHDVIAQPTMKLSLSVLEEHFTRACSGRVAGAHTLPASIPSQVDRASAERNCRLLPHRTDPILYIQPFTKRITAPLASSSYPWRHVVRVRTATCFDQRVQLANMGFGISVFLILNPL